jgi:primosomal protein N' (replication factor Y)
MKRELRHGNGGNLSSLLCEEIQKNLDRGEQSILFINRRGANKLITCGDCGFVYKCPRCSVSLTYHSYNDRLRCHYCGYVQRLDAACPDCGGILKRIGAGTQLVEEELHERFPEIQVLRMDSDTVAPVGSHEQLLEQFREKKIPVLVGTQMVTKGLNFENVTLVGVLLIDKSLYAGDYLGFERTFSLITQVVGRSGRGSKKGRAYLQTFSPDHYVLELAAKQDYKGFYAQESQVREALIFPPYCDICMIAFASPEESAVETAAGKFRDLLDEQKRNCGREMPLIILGPTAGSRVNGSFRAKIIIKCRNTKPFRDMLRYVMLSAGKLPEFRKVSFYPDFNGEII